MFAATEGANPKLQFWRTSEKDESQTAQAQAVRSTQSTGRSCEAARECEEKESRMCVTAVAPDCPQWNRGRPEYGCFQRFALASQRQAPPARRGPVQTGREFTKPLEVSAFVFFQGIRHTDGFLL